METPTKTNPSDRELTKTEVAIATAQIADRLSRLAAAAEEIFHGDGDVITERAIREKHGIPEGVVIVEDEIEPVLMMGHRKWIGYFVKGEMTEGFLNDIIDDAWLFMNYDFAWVWMGEVDRDPEFIRGEMISIGCRSRKKCRAALQWETKSAAAAAA